MERCIDIDKILDEAEDIARAWVTARLNVDEDSRRTDLLFFFDNVLSPYMKESGAEGGFALCYSLVNLSASIADATSNKLGISPQEIIQLDYKEV